MPTIRNRAGFTLIELLVVIAIIAILAAMIFPALASAKATAKQAQCTNNQKQLALAWTTYAASADDLFAANARQSPASPSQKLWVQGVFVNPGDNFNPTLITSQDYSLFASYIKTVDVYVCPADRQTVKVGAQEYPKLRSYALNAYVGWAGVWDYRLATGYKIFRQVSDITTTTMPSGLMLFGDVQPDSICWPFYGVEMDMNYYFNFPGSMHKNGSVISYADGHADYHQWQVDQTIKAFATYYHMHHEGVTNTTDLAWLRERTTVKDTGPNRSGFGYSGDPSKNRQIDPTYPGNFPNND